MYYNLSSYHFINDEIFHLLRLSGLVVNSNIKLSKTDFSLVIDETNTIIRNSIISGGNFNILNSNNSKLVCTDSIISTKLSNPINVINHNNSRSTLLNNKNTIHFQQSENSFSNLDHIYHNDIQYHKSNFYTDGEKAYWLSNYNFNSIIDLPNDYAILTSKINSDLQGNTVTLILSSSNTDYDYNFNNFCNGKIIIKSKENISIKSLKIRNSKCKIIIQDIETFNSLIIDHCDNVKIIDCIFNNTQTSENILNKNINLPNIRNNLLILNKEKFTKAILVMHSKVFIFTSKKSFIEFNNYDISIFAYQSSRIYLKSNIRVKQNLNGKNILRFRPIVLGAFLGSYIFYKERNICFY